ncbi:hypothetical protein N7462_004619 [Penicillium macrosclerotiorum]|uniref:uncharacterized protein n=1 Tax=Penicillium macrosclerotiorum TaxID=303699 RepID=UPI00254875AF|nr:uncharacterized protein N7462_004619 [Penicillium macrosclerotiorum]KAJ5690227.1 hypothetical protein N7462_004619 [Penicillium macrosclerotiorum]
MSTGGFAKREGGSRDESVRGRIEGNCEGEEERVDQGEWLVFGTASVWVRGGTLPRGWDSVDETPVRASPECIARTVYAVPYTEDRYGTVTLDQPAAVSERRDLVPDRALAMRGSRSIGGIRDWKRSPELGQRKGKQSDSSYVRTDLPVTSQ